VSDLEARLTQNSGSLTLPPITRWKKKFMIMFTHIIHNCFINKMQYTYICTKCMHEEHISKFAWK
jgi:hypothetical protein